MKIRTALDIPGITDLDTFHEWLLVQPGAVARLEMLGIRASQVGRPDHPNMNGSPAIAVVNHGRWIANCPTDQCGGAAFCFPGARVFLCANCANVENGCQWRPLTWPPPTGPDSRGAIEEALSARLLPEQAHWVPGETVAHLLAENALLIGAGGVALL